MNVNTICIECKYLISDDWLFEAIDQHGNDCWVCGNCAGLEEEK